jgi:hypothetical protein
MQRAVLLEDEKKQIELSENLSDLQQQLKSRVDMAAPLLEKAEVGLSKLEFQNISELRAVASPSDSLLAASRAIAIILTPRGKPLPGADALTWKEVKKMFSKVELILNCLNRFNVKDASSEALALVEAKYLSLPVFKEDPKDPPVVEGLKTWAVNIVGMFHVYETIKPQQRQLNAASKEWEQMMTKVSDLSGRVNTLEARLRGLMSNFQDATEEKNAAIARLKDLTASCDISGKLAGALHVSRTNPIEEAKQRYEEEEEALLGDALVAAALVTYGGCMDEAMREVLMQDNVLADLRAQKIKVSHGSPHAALQTLTTGATMAMWKAKGLLDSRYYLESAAIALHSTAWPLLVDPQGLALAWLTGHVEEYVPPSLVPPAAAAASVGGTSGTGGAGVGGVGGGVRALQGLSSSTPNRKRPQSASKTPHLTVVSNTSSDLVNVLRTCLAVGQQMAITGPLTRLRRDILMVLLRSFFLHNRVTVVEVGGELLEVNPDFRLYLLTGKGRVGFDPQLASTCTVINFQCSVAGLHDSIVDLVMRAEMPEMMENAGMLLARRRSLLEEQEHLEDSMLLSLGESDGIVLSDAVVSRLVDDLGLMGRVCNKLKSTEVDGKAIEASRAAYHPLVETVEAIFQATEQMEQICPAYIFSTTSFLDAVAEGLQSAEAELEPFEWHTIFKGDWGGTEVGSSGSSVEYDQEDAASTRDNHGDTNTDQQTAAASDAGFREDTEADDVGQPGARDGQDKKASAKGTQEKKERDGTGGAGLDSTPDTLGCKDHHSAMTMEVQAGAASPREKCESRPGSHGNQADEDIRPGTVEIPDAAERLRVLETYICRNVMKESCAGMLSSHRLVFAVYAAIQAAFSRTHGADHARVHEVLEVFFTFSNLSQKGNTFQVSAAKPAWLSDGSYAAVAQLSQVRRGSPLGNLLASLNDFQELVESSDGERSWPDGWVDSLHDIEKWVVMQVCVCWFVRKMM